jgi:hypothetical protein
LQQIGEPAVQAAFSHSPIGGVSAVARALKRYPLRLDGIAADVPRTYPYHNVSVRFVHTAFECEPRKILDEVRQTMGEDSFIPASVGWNAHSAECYRDVGVWRFAYTPSGLIAPPATGVCAGS